MGVFLESFWGCFPAEPSTPFCLGAQLGLYASHIALCLSRCARHRVAHWHLTGALFALIRAGSLKSGCKGTNYFSFCLHFLLFSAFFLSCTLILIAPHSIYPPLFWKTIPFCRVFRPPKNTLKSRPQHVPMFTHRRIRTFRLEDMFLSLLSDKNFNPGRLLKDEAGSLYFEDLPWHLSLRRTRDEVSGLAAAPVSWLEASTSEEEPAAPRREVLASSQPGERAHTRDFVPGYSPLTAFAVLAFSQCLSAPSAAERNIMPDRSAYLLPESPRRISLADTPFAPAVFPLRARIINRCGRGGH